MDSLAYIWVFVLLEQCYSATWFSNAIDTLDNGPVRMKPENKIVGGVESTIEQYPYQVALNINSSILCGGTIISPDIVMTAAHCVVNVTPDVILARSGGDRWYTGGVKLPVENVIVVTPDVILVRSGSDRWYTGGVKLPVENVIVHPQYNTPPFDYDIALLRLRNPVEFTSATKSIPLPDADLVIPDNTLVTISGWGLTKNGGTTIPDRLMAVTVPVINRIVCKILYYFSLTEHMFCAGYFGTGGKGSCQGDSGGPVTINGTVVVGIVSFGRGCAQALSPGVYASVPSLRDWIHEKTGL